MIHFAAMSRSFQIWSSALQPDKGEGREIIPAHLAAIWSARREPDENAHPPALL